MMLPSRWQRWFRRFSPFLDLHLVPLKQKHQYWFGVLLLARGILLICYSSTLFNVAQDTNLLILFIFGVLFIFYMSATFPYQNTAVLLVNGSFLTNMALLSGFALFAEAHPHGSTIRTVTATLSAALAFIIFCGIIIYGIICALRYRLFNRKTTNTEMMTSLAANGGSNNDEKQRRPTQGTRIRQNNCCNILIY